MNRLLFSSVLLSTLIALCAASTAQAAPYADVSSTTGDVSFINISDLNGLYGAPTASGNTIDFTPTGFAVTCPGAPGCPPATGSIADSVFFQIDANAGFAIEDIIFQEAGDTLIQDFGGFAATSVVADVVIDVLELDGVSVNGINGNAVMVFTSGGTFDTTTEGSGTHNWTGYLALDVDAVIAGAGQSGKATLVQISLSNTLTALGENGGFATIAKKDVDGLAITVIPEPATALLMMLGLAGLAVVGPSRRGNAR